MTPKSAKRSRIGRSIFEKWQTNIMSKFFVQTSAYVDKLDIEKLSQETGLDFFQIRKWFSNKRQRFRVSDEANAE